MMRLANYKDLVKLKARYQSSWLTEEDFALNQVRDPNWSFSEDHHWGLKQMGNLFCWNEIVNREATRILEVGAGFDLSFDRRLDERHEFWIADKMGFYSQDLLDEANRRRSARFVDTLLGEFSKGLPDNYFDLVFSVSALEHTQEEERDNICKDMYRVLRPGGACVHSIDTYSCYSENFCKGWFENFNVAGFGIPDGLGETQWVISPYRGQSILTEPLSIVFNYYDGLREDAWDNIVLPAGPYGTVLVIAEKPA